MECTYTIYDVKTGVASGPHSYQDLVDMYNEGYGSFSDIVFSLSDKLQATRSKLIEKTKEYAEAASKAKFETEPTYGDKWTPQTLIDSGHFTLKGERIMLEENDDEFIAHRKAALIKEAEDKGIPITEEEAEEKAQAIVDAWKKINEDAKTFHKLVCSFNFMRGSMYDFEDHLKGTKFELLADTLYNQIRNDLFKVMYGSHGIADDKAAVLQGINLTAKLNGLGEDIIGHYDNLVIDSKGIAHIYNYKVTTGPVSDWKASAVKLLKYKYLMAMLKQILAYNGFNVKGCEMHYIPVLLEYDKNIENITNATVHKNEKISDGRDFHAFRTAAKYFISSHINLAPSDKSFINRVNGALGHIFPERGIKLQGINKSVDEWIKFNYSSKWENRIKRVDAPDHTYEVFLDDEFEKAISIKDPTKPIDNEEIRKVVYDHLNKRSEDEGSFLGSLLKDIKVSHDKGFSIIFKNNTSNRRLSLATSFISKSLRKYFVKNEDGLSDWELISNDLLEEANILLFKHRSGVVDVVCLSDYDLYTKTQFGKNTVRGKLRNIMGHYIPDDRAGKLINYEATYANIEAVRIMTILNEVLPELSDNDAILGLLKILSTRRNGQVFIDNLETLNRDLFQEVVKVVKRNASEFKFTNNFSLATYSDPIELLMYEYNSIVGDDYGLDASLKKTIEELGFTALETLSGREAKRVHLKAIIEKIYRDYPDIQAMSPEEIILEAAGAAGVTNSLKALVRLYIACQQAYNYYSGITVSYQERISKAREYAMTLNRIKNQSYLNVVNAFTKAVDTVAYRVNSEYDHIRKFTMDFYDAMGYGNLRNSSIGDQARAFNNLYRRESGNRLMEFRNPYKTDSLPPLNDAEKTYLKKVLFEFAKIRSKIFGFDFDFTSAEDPKLQDFIGKNKSWYFNVPLKRASGATLRTRSISENLEEWKRKAKMLLSKGRTVEAFNEFVLQMEFSSDESMMRDNFDVLHLDNSMALYDGYKGGESMRLEMLNKEEYKFETNVENILASYLERQVLVEEFNSTLITVKAILLNLEILGQEIGENNRAGIELTVKMIQDFTKLNVFNLSIMEPESQKILAWLAPFRKAVSKAYIAGNIVSMFRDTVEGVLHNFVRTVTKYLTDISAANLVRAYKHVTSASFTTIRNITIIDELCRLYRLSNSDISRISNMLTTSRGGILNIEEWAYATLRAPDFLNRMTLFVAKCMEDGCWEAFDLKDGKLVYNWRKDARFSVYADGLANPSKLSNTEFKRKYEELRIAYYNAVRLYRQENPSTDIDVNGDLPIPYSDNEIYLMRQLSNSIYGAYDKSMRAKYESTALGTMMCMFSTWMNGMISNYTTAPGLYAGSMTELKQRTDGSGNELFMDKNGIEVTAIQEGDSVRYIYSESGEEVPKDMELVPIMDNVPVVIQGILYSLKDIWNVIINSKGSGWKNFKSEIWNNPMQKANLKKLLADLFILALFTALFKLALDPAYKDFKKGMKERSIAENAIVEVLYKGSSRSFDGFNPLAPIVYLGKETNPPAWQLSTKVGSDLLKTAFGDKTVKELVTGNLAFFNSFRDSIRAERLKE